LARTLLEVSFSQIQKSYLKANVYEAHLFANGTLAALIANERGVVIVNVTNPRSITKTSSYEFTGKVRQLFLN
jgi:hypothetical protein